MLSKADPVSLEDDHGVYGTPGDLTPWDVRFDPSNRAFLDANPDGSLRFRVWSDPSLADGMLVVRDGEKVSGYKMEVAAETIRFIYWEVVTDRLPEGAEFSFAFRTKAGKGVYRVPSGISNAVERLDRWPVRHPQPISVPNWARGALIYQVFPDRFARSSDELVEGLQPWDAEPERFALKGGDLAGVTQKLDYLAALGVDILYLNPIFVSPSNHRYDTIDYYNVDPLLGGNEALKELVTEAHVRSMKVVLDASFNHVHPRFFAFRDVVEKGPNSEYWDWFVVEDWPVRVGYRADLAKEDARLDEYVRRLEDELDFPIHPVTTGPRPIRPTYDAWYGVPTMPRVNLANREARKYMLEVAAYWIREYDVDGWRMDVVRYVDPDFWDDFREKTRAVKPDVFLLSEVMGDSSTWLQGDKFDATMNYTFRDLCLRFFATDDIDGPAMMDGLARAWAQYAWPVTLTAQNLISSHDTPRFLTEADGEKWRLRLASVLQMTYPGAPGVYYGDEVGMAGGKDPGSRGGFPWGADPTQHQVHQTIRELAQLRSVEPALLEGEWRPLNARDGLIVFQRSHGDRRLVVAINRSNEAAATAVAAREVLWGEADLGDETLTVPPRSAVVALQ